MRPGGRRSLGDRLHRLGRSWLTLAFVCLVVVPLYALVLVVVVRSDLWQLGGGPFNDEQFKALLLFLGAALGTVATVVGFLLTKASSERSLAQQQLDSAVQALSLIKQDDGYAAKAVTAGALATLVHLGHPVIAMRTLQAALDDDAVDLSTAVWLIDQVLTATPVRGARDDLVVSKQDAVELLATQLPRLPDDDHPGNVAWPLCAVGAWPPDLGQQPGWRLMHTLLGLLVSRDAGWWTSRGLTWSWVIASLDRAASDETVEIGLRQEAARHGLQLLGALTGDVNTLYDTEPRDAVRARLAAVVAGADEFANPKMRDAVTAWVDRATA
ncbi:hypothetical protein [Nocardioides speluncae]|uniref:hypothetical protein n=1 Tax=Nocardioides speluncae TaxID=2670337 RepID=UPI000D688ADC|nr:hypothetical protein [Nocardioides speluncae]